MTLDELYASYRRMPSNLSPQSYGDTPIPLDPQTMQPLPMGSMSSSSLGQQPNFRWQAQAANMGRNFLGDRDLALALLANSGASPYKRGFGEVLGSSMLQADQAKRDRSNESIMNAYRMAQIQALQNRPQNQADGMGDYQPGNYTPASWAKFVKTRDPADLVRYESPRQETSRPFQNITRTYPDGSTQQGNFDTRTGDFTPTGPLLPPGVKPEADAAGTARGKVQGDLAAKGPRAYEQFKIGIQGLESAMSETMTGPIAGRFPAFTSAQQTAEGSEAIMAPILKQLFRESGEGTFTEGDQALLLKMVPGRTDRPEARKAKIEMIDAIVKAKLGIQDGASAAPTAPGATPAQTAAKELTYDPVTGTFK